MFEKFTLKDIHTHTRARAHTRARTHTQRRAYSHAPFLPRLSRTLTFHPLAFAILHHLARFPSRSPGLALVSIATECMQIHVYTQHAQRITQSETNAYTYACRMHVYANVNKHHHHVHSKKTPSLLTLRFK